jgi:hypothetical protein
MTDDTPWGVAAEALRLRGWALRLLAGGAGEPPAASARAWEALVLGERCALPLRARSRAFPDEARAVLERCATAELQRFLSVQAQTRLVGALLHERGWPGVVLKGAAHAVEGGEPLDAADVDVLLPREHAVEFAALLEERGGHRALGTDAAGASGTGWQLATRLAEGGVQVEVHFDVPFLAGEGDPWEATLPTPVRGVLRLSPANHLWHVLVHGVVHHVDRRGSLRELLLLRSARAACGAEDLREVERRAAAHPAARPLRATLRMLEALAAGARPDDPFRALAAARYALVAGAGKRWGSGRFGMAAASSAFALAEGGGAYRGLWMGSPASALVGPGFRGSTRWDRFPLPAWGARVAWRMAHLAGAVVPAWRAARAARRLARVPPDGETADTPASLGVGRG